MSKAIFLDRDGTINLDKNYLYKKEDFEILPGVIDALRLLQDRGYKLIIITNQSGIARGFYNEQQYHELNKWMIEMFQKEGIYITDSYYCPHHPEAKLLDYRCECDCRKPKVGLFEKAIAKYSIDLDQSYAVGDKIRDCSICATTGCHGFLIGNNEKQIIISDVKKGKVRHVYYEESLFKAAKRIVNN